MEATDGRICWQQSLCVFLEGFFFFPIFLSFLFKNIQLLFFLLNTSNHFGYEPLKVKSQTSVKKNPSRNSNMQIPFLLLQAPFSFAEKITQPLSCREETVIRVWFSTHSDHNLASHEKKAVIINIVMGLIPSNGGRFGWHSV